MRDPGDPIELLWSALGNSGLDVIILRALAKYRRRPGRWHDLGNLDAVIMALDAIVASERELEAREEALRAAKEAHAGAIAAIASAPRWAPSEALAAPRGAIIRLIRTRAGGRDGS